jgi:hypothetical protein
MNFVLTPELHDWKQFWCCTDLKRIRAKEKARWFMSFLVRRVDSSLNFSNSQPKFKPKVHVSQKLIFSSFILPNVAIINHKNKPQIWINFCTQKCYTKKFSRHQNQSKFIKLLLFLNPFLMCTRLCIRYVTNIMIKHL